MAKKKQDTWVDDGRVIVDMMVDGMPESMSDKMLGSSRPKQPRVDSSGRLIQPPEPIELTRDEKKQISQGVIRATLLVGGAILLAFTLVFLFLVFVWMR